MELLLSTFLPDSMRYCSGIPHLGAQQFPGAPQGIAAVLAGWIMLDRRQLMIRLDAEDMLCDANRHFLNGVHACHSSVPKYSRSSILLGACLGKLLYEITTLHYMVKAVECESDFLQRSPQWVSSATGGS
jgi:hypothetical protein